MEQEKLNFEDFNLVNDLGFSKDEHDDVKEISLEVTGLGSVTSYEYTYNDICPNAMK